MQQEAEGGHRAEREQDDDDHGHGPTDEALEASHCGRQRERDDADAMRELAASPLELAPGLELEWLGVAGYRMTYEGQTLYIDPYLSRVPLASGLLTGKLRPDSAFEADDHRNFNRHGEAFDVGETFSGVDYNAGLEAVEEIRALLPPGVTMSQFALRWILMFDAVSCAIPGGKRPDQVTDNCRASGLPPLSPEAMATIRNIYDTRFGAALRHRW